MKKKLIILLCLLVAIGGQAVTYKLDSDIAYSSKTDPYSRERLKLDVYYPDSAENVPVVVWFHGGGLTGGQKEIPEGLKDAGYVVVGVNYRLVPNVAVADCIDDAAEAVAWAMKNVGRYGGDTAKLFVSGHSAGGFLTSMIGLDKSRLVKYGVDADDIAGLIPFSGQVITHFSDRKAQGIGELTPLIDKNAPLYHVRKDAPPYVIVTGDAEMELYGRYEENLYMWRMMKLKGHPFTRIYKLDGYDHGSMCTPAFPILRNIISEITQSKHQGKP